MTLKTPDTFIKGQLHVGETLLTPVGFGVGPLALKGAAYVAGPLMVGDTKPFLSPPGIPQATCMITKRSSLDGLLDGSPSAADQATGLIPSPSIMIVSNSIEQPVPLPTDVLIGNPILPVGVTINTGISLFTVFSTKETHFSLADIGWFSPFTEQIAALNNDIGGKVFAGAKTELGADSNFAIAMNAAPIVGSAPIVNPDTKTSLTTVNKNFWDIRRKKNFDIPHPTKEGWRLRHVCIEAPQADVYVRGRLKDNTVIELPDYWKGLVDQETIDVSLTPIGSYQELYVESVQWGSRIIVKNNAGGPINCSYVVYAERKDGEKNIPEYEGTSYNDYPGNNDEYTQGTSAVVE